MAEHGFEYEFIEGTFYVCSLCHYAWKTRVDGVEPRSCPSCSSRLWKQSYEHECCRCGHNWTTSRNSPKKCPSCQSMKWNEGEKPVEENITSVPQAQRDTILERYSEGIGIVRISRELGITFSDVYDVVHAQHPDREPKL